jgi:hypothetical protein
VLCLQGKKVTGKDVLMTMPDEEGLSAAETEALLRRQTTLQAEASAILTELDLVDRLSRIGSVRQIGSSTLGLMVWRDVDLAISGPTVTIERALDTMRPLFLHPRVRQVRYLNETGASTPTGVAVDERWYFQVFIDTRAGDEWKLDLSFWLGEELHSEPVHEAIARELTPETRLAILWIKDRWHRLPSYRQTVSSTDIYDAVLRHGIRTPEQFNRYLLSRDKPAQSAVSHDGPVLPPRESQRDS